MADDQRAVDLGTGEDPFEVPLEEAAARAGITAAALYKRIRAGTVAARQEPAGRRRWMLRTADVAALESGRATRPAAGEWPADLLGVLAEQLRLLDVAHTEVREAEQLAVRLEAENTALRSQVRDLQNVLRATWHAMSTAMGESVNALTMPDTPND